MLIVSDPRPPSTVRSTSTQTHVMQTITASLGIFLFFSLLSNSTLPMTLPYKRTHTPNLSCRRTCSARIHSVVQFPTSLRRTTNFVHAHHHQHRTHHEMRRRYPFSLLLIIPPPKKEGYGRPEQIPKALVPRSQHPLIHFTTNPRGHHTFTPAETPDTQVSNRRWVLFERPVLPFPMVSVDCVCDKTVV